METKAQLNEHGEMEYLGEDGNNLYQKADGGGMKGTVLPASNRTDQGGSTAFDIDQPIPIIIDPDYTQHTIIFDPAKDTLAVADGSVIPKTGFDNQDVRLEMANKMKAAIIKGVPEIPPTPVAEAVVYNTEVPIAPPSTPPVPQEVVYTEPQPILTATPMPTLGEEGVVELPDGKTAEYISPVVKDPEVKVIFHLGEAVGDFECFYHRVFKHGVCLVLVWDNRYHGSRYTPSSSLKDVISLTVGTDRYNVYLGPKFLDQFRDEEYWVMFIEEPTNGEEL